MLQRAVRHLVKPVCVMSKHHLSALNEIAEDALGEITTLSPKLAAQKLLYTRTSCDL